MAEAGEEKFIENAEIVIDHFGYWPSFEDSEVISIKMERALDKSSASIQLRMYSFEMTEEVIDDNYQITKHCFIDFEFSEVINTEFDGFNHQNSVVALEFGKQEDNQFCHIVSAHGVDGYLEARRIRVVRLEPVDDNNPVVE